jgi:hypothetical protein
MISPQSIRQGDTGRCDQNGLGRAEQWTSLSPWIQSYRDLPLLMNQWANVHRWQGLTLVQFPAQLGPGLTQETTVHTLDTP